AGPTQVEVDPAGEPPRLLPDLPGGVGEPREGRLGHGQAAVREGEPDPLQRGPLRLRSRLGHPPPGVERGVDVAERRLAEPEGIFHLAEARPSRREPREPFPGLGVSARLIVAPGLLEALGMAPRPDGPGPGPSDDRDDRGDHQQASTRAKDGHEYGRSWLGGRRAGNIAARIAPGPSLSTATRPR